MERLAEIQSRLKDLGDLVNVVGAMRSLAAVRVQQAHGALPGMRKYAGVVDAALADAFAIAGSSVAAARSPLRSAVREGPSVVIVFASEQGFVGAFNDHLLDHVATAVRANDALFLVGSRGGALAEERRIAVGWKTAMPTRADGVVDVARRIAAEVYRRAATGGLGGVSLVYARTSGGSQSEVVVRKLLPFDPTPYLADRAAMESVPLTNLDGNALIERLVDELVLAELMRAAMESFASENGARLATMESAHRSIEKKAEELSGTERRLRQDEITTELLDIVTGAEAAG